MVFDGNIELCCRVKINLFDAHFESLVGGLEHVLFFHSLGRIIPTDELRDFFRGVVLKNHQPVMVIE
jgi:hypothetical protein